MKLPPLAQLLQALCKGSAKPKGGRMGSVTLYGHLASWNVARVMVCLEEAGVPYNMTPLDLFGGEHKRPEFLARNPFGQVPVLEDGDLCLFESRACTRYVARKYKPDLLKEGKPEEAAIVDVWIEVESHAYDTAVGQVLFQTIIRPMMGGTCDEAIVNEHIEKLKSVFAVYEERLTKHEFLAGDFISIADLNHVSTLFLLVGVPCGSVLNNYPHVKAWTDRLLARPAVQKVTTLLNNK